MKKNERTLIFAILMIGMLFVSTQVYAQVPSETVEISTAQTTMQDLVDLSGGATPKTALVTPTGSVILSSGGDPAIWAKESDWTVTVSSSRDVQGRDYGILFNETTDGSGNDLTGTLVNGGNISASGTSSGDGLRLGDNCTVTNQSGASISGSTTIDDSHGILVDASATINNAGSISATSTGHGSIGILPGTNSVITNLSGGSISASGGNFTRGIDNRHDITIRNESGATVSANNTVQGVTAIHSDSDSTVINAGTITANGGSYAYGIYEGSNGSVTNSGTITANATISVAYGIYGGSNGSVTNSGTITANTTSSSNDYSSAYGIFAFTGTITNESGGDISASGNYWADGILISNGIVLNSGSITANATGSGSTAYGINISGGGTITNKSGGTILAASAGSAYGVGGTGEVINEAGATITSSGTGVWMDSGSTITNYGAITGTGGTAIELLGDNNTVKIYEGSTLTGELTASGLNNSLEFIGTGTYDSDITGTWVLTKSGDGIVALSGSNSYTGGTTVSSGILQGNTSSLQGDILNNSQVTFDQGSAGTYAGVMSGVGSLVKEGADKLTLTGANLYTGGTTVSGGILQGNTTSLQGDILNNSQVTFDQGSAGTYAGVMSGVGSLVKEGADKLTLTGANLYTGGTTVSAGILQGNTSSLQGDILNNSQVIFDQGAAGTYAGIMSGVGSLVKEGADKLTLTGANLYTGGTTVSTGILQGNTSSLQGDILNNSQVTFDQGSAGTYAGIMSGTGSLLKEGSGTLNLTGGNTYSGGTSINAGALAVNGGITGTVTIGSAGALSGAGSVGSVINSGNIAPGNSIGTLTINGDVTFAGNSVYEVEANAAGQSDRLDVTGAATLNGGTVAVLAESGTYAQSTNYTILSAESVTGAFTDVTSNLVFLTPTLDYDSSNIYLRLTRNTTDFADVAITANQISLASGLDRISQTTTGDMEAVITSLLSLSDQGARIAFDQAGGLTHMALAEASSFAFDRYVNVLSDRIRDTITSSVTDTATDRGFWIKGYGSTGDRKDDDISTNFDYTIGGLALGCDQKVGNNGLLGASAGFTDAKADMDGLDDTAEVSIYQAALYGAYQSSQWYFNGIIAYGHNSYESSRNIAFDSINRTAKADYTGHELSGYAEAGYNVKIDTFSITPLASLQASHLNRNGFTEKGAGSLNLSVKKENTQSFTSALGVRVKKDYHTSLGIITPDIRLRWLHEFQDVEYQIDAAFDGYSSSAFIAQTDKTARDSAAFDLGIAWRIKDNLDLVMAYNATISSDRTQHTGLLGVTFWW